MAIIKTLNAYPTKLLYTNNADEFSDWKNMFDGNLNAETYFMEIVSSTTIFGGFDFTELPSDAIVKDIAVFIKCRMEYSDHPASARLVRNATGISKYTDLGDGQIELVSSTSTTESLKSFPIATTVCTADFLKGGNLQLRLYYGRMHGNEMYVKVTYEIPSHTIIATASPTAGGTVTGGGDHEAGTTVTLTATPHTGYRFKQWSDGNTNATRTVTVTADATYTAQFEALQFTISTQVSPQEAGAVLGGGTYAYGTNVQLSVAAKQGYAFVQWADGVTSENRTVRVTQNTTYTAIFEKAATSNTFRGTSRQTIYRGTEKQAVYIGSNKIT